MRVGATENRLLNREQFFALAIDRSRRVRGHLATFRGDLPLDVLERLARDKSVDVRWALTASRQPESVREILRNDPHPDVGANMEQWQPKVGD